MAILYVAAEGMELKPFASALVNLRKLNWPIDYAFEGIQDGKRIVLVANGAGPKLASQAVEVALRAVTGAELSSSKLEAVVSTGFCGALSESLREFEIVLGDAIITESRDSLPCKTVSAAPDGFVTGSVLSQNRVINTAVEKRALADGGAIAADMEAEGVARRTNSAALPFYCIKVVSDRADEGFAFDLNRMRTSEGRISRGKIISYTLGHPGIVPQVWRLKRRAEDAAEALGEFLVSCRILPESDSTLA